MKIAKHKHIELWYDDVYLTSVQNNRLHSLCISLYKLTLSSLFSYWADTPAYDKLKREFILFVTIIVLMSFFLHKKK